MRFDIRRKEFPYSSAPILDGITAGYEALVVLYTGGIVAVMHSSFSGNGGNNCSNGGALDGEKQPLGPG